MTATTTTAREDIRPSEPDTGSVGPAHSGWRRGAVLLIGAVVIALVVKPIGPLAYYWNPLLVGVAFTAAAAATGPRSPLWGAGLVVGFWGLSKVIDGTVTLSWGGPFSTVMIGLGGLLAAFLASRGFAVSVASIAFPVVFLGVGQYIHSTYHGWPITAYTAGVALVYGLVELFAATRKQRQPAALQS